MQSNSGSAGLGMRPIEEETDKTSSGAQTAEMCLVDSPSEKRLN